MRREKLEHLATNGMIEGKRCREKQRGKILDGVTKWLKIGQVREALKVMKNTDVWKVMIA